MTTVVNTILSDAVTRSLLVQTLARMIEHDLSSSADREELVNKSTTPAPATLREAEADVARSDAPAEEPEACRR